MPNLRLTSILHHSLTVLCALAICNLLAFATACARTYGENYFPLRDGARWEYTGRFSTADGRQYPARATARVDGTTLIHGNRYFKYVFSSDLSNVPGAPQSPTDVRYYRVASDGIYIINGQNPTNPELLEMPLPIPLGTKWLSGRTEVQAEAAGTVEVGGRSYRDCLKLTFKQADGIHSVQYYLAPDVGMVKAVFESANPSKSTFELTLESYKL